MDEDAGRIFGDGVAANQRCWCCRLARGPDRRPGCRPRPGPPAVPWRISGSPGIHLMMCYSNSLKYKKESVRPQFLSLRQHVVFGQSPRPLIGPEKPAVSGGRLFTSVRPSRWKTPLSGQAFSSAVHLAHSVPTRKSSGRSVGYAASQRCPVSNFHLGHRGQSSKWRNRLGRSELSGGVGVERFSIDGWWIMVDFAPRHQTLRQDAQRSAFLRLLSQRGHSKHRSLPAAG